MVKMFEGESVGKDLHSKKGSIWFKFKTLEIIGIHAKHCWEYN